MNLEELEEYGEVSLLYSSGVFKLYIAPFGISKKSLLSDGFTPEEAIEKAIAWLRSSEEGPLNTCSGIEKKYLYDRGMEFTVIQSA